MDFTTGNTWNEEDVGILKSRYLTEKNLKTLASDLNRTVGAIHKKAASYGLSRSRRDHSERGLMSVLSEEPKSTSEIAAELGIRVDSAVKMLNKCRNLGICKVHSKRQEGHKVTRLWVTGEGRAAKRACSMTDSWALTFKPFRHWMDCALYGEPA